jgi:hypothetical protein
MQKKDRERYQLERFRTVFPMFPAGTIIDGKDNGSEPDFFVKAGESLVLGVELTELYRTPEPNQQPRQAGENIRKQIVDRACSIHQGHSGPALDVSVHFSMNQGWDKKRVPWLASKLAQLVFNNPPAEGQKRWLQNPWLNPTHFPYEIDSIDIRRYDWITKPHWSSPDVDCIPQLSKDDLQTVIDRKNDRISSYRQKGAEEVWLLIIHGLALSSMFDSNHDPLDHEYRSEFSRTFFFNWFGQTYSEIKTQPVAFRAEIKAESSPETAPDL